MKPRIEAKDWYRVERRDDDVTYICEPHIQEFYRCNIWHIRGRDRDMLVDSGMGVVSLRTWVPLVSERDLIAVASHTHFDHVGCHHEFECRAVHSAEAGLLSNPTRENTLADPYVTDDIFEGLPPEPYCSKCYGVKSAPASRVLEDRDVVDLGDRHFEVVHTPGHSPGGIALWEGETGILFSGDILYDGPLIEDTYHANADDYVTSMERLLKLPVRVVHGGHFPSFSGARYQELIKAWLDSKRA